MRSPIKKKRPAKTQAKSKAKPRSKVRGKAKPKSRRLRAIANENSPERIQEENLVLHTAGGEIPVLPPEGVETPAKPRKKAA